MVIEPATELQQARLDHGWTQADVIRELLRHAAIARTPIAKPDSLKTMLSRWENGAHISAPYPELLGQVFRCSTNRLGLSPDAKRTPARRQSTFRVTPRLDLDTVSYFRNVLTEQQRADYIMGPHHLIDVVRAQTVLLDQLLPHAHGPIRLQLVDLACRYNEFAGWLYQDAGDPETAMAFSDCAMDYALEIDDANEISYVLMRKANVAVDLRKPDRAIGLTDAALRDRSKLSPRIRALILGQRARAQAALGTLSNCSKTIEQAYQEVSRPFTDVERFATYCTPAYLAMEAASCLVTLGQYDAAVPIYERSAATWPSDYQRRDQGLCLARLTVAYIGNSDIAGACRSGTQAVELVASATSTRALRELDAVRTRLLPWRHDAEVWELRNQIRQLTKV
jgi:tetratricopeptide (TPR) repeat protein